MLDSLLPKTYATLICDNEPHTVTYSTILNYAVRKAPTASSWRKIYCK